MKRSLSVIGFVLISLSFAGYFGDTTGQSVANKTISREMAFDNWQDVVAIEQTHTFGVSEPVDHPEAWEHISELTPGPNGSVLLIDMHAEKVHLLDHRKGVISSFGSGIGGGPGELRNPVGVAWIPESGVYISDSGNGRISLFNLDGEYIRDIHPDIPCGDLNASADGNLWMGRTLNRDIDRIFLINTDDASILAETGGRYRNESWYGRLIAPAKHAPTKDGVLVSVQYPYELAEYNQAGELLRIFGRVVRWLGPPKNISERQTPLWAPSGGGIGGVSVFPDGKVLCNVYRQFEEEMTSIGIPRFRTEQLFDLFNSEGYWITSIPLSALDLGNASSGATTISSDGALWVVFVGDYYQIVRFEVSMEDRLIRNHFK